MKSKSPTILLSLLSPLPQLGTPVFSASSLLSSVQMLTVTDALPELRSSLIPRSPQYSQNPPAKTRGISVVAKTKTRIVNKKHQTICRHSDDKLQWSGTLSSLSIVPHISSYQYYIISGGWSLTFYCYMYQCTIDYVRCRKIVSVRNQTFKRCF